ncbi:MAG: SPASM domain-containing protein [Candidatus Electrothrix sp. AW5]|nr:SPASM domain-containing protein [Candidatus Electrothrix gigas]
MKDVEYNFICLLIMQSSVFNQTVPAEGCELLFNTLSGSIVELEAPLMQIVKESPVATQVLLRNGHCVQAGTTVEQEYAAFFAKRTAPTSVLNVLLTITTKCNLSCEYCFENRITRRTMTPATLAQTLKFLEQRCKHINAQRLRVSIFGGEPFLEPQLILWSLTGLREVCDRCGIILDPIQVVTNGMHADPNLLDQLMREGVSRVQVTFDGAKAIHDKRRQYRAGIQRSSYDDALSNLPVYAERFQLAVKLNFDPSTIEHVEPLLDDLIGGGRLEPHVFLIKPEAIQPYRNSQPQSLFFSTNSTDNAVAFKGIIDMCNIRNIRLDLSAVFPTPCMLTQPNSILIEPDGSIRSCISAFGMAKFHVGDVKSGLNKANDRVSVTTNFDTSDITKCISKACAFLPVCNGGCKYELAVRRKPIESMLCRQDYFDAVLPLYVRTVHAQSSRRLRLGIP